MIKTITHRRLTKQLPCRKHTTRDLILVSDQHHELRTISTPILQMRKTEGQRGSEKSHSYEAAEPGLEPTAI